MRRTLFPLLLAAITVTATAQTQTIERTAQLNALKQRAALSLHANDACTPKRIAPPVTVTGTIDTTSCLDNIGLLGDFYQFDVTAGQTMDVDMNSTAFSAYMWLSLGGGDFIPTDIKQFLGSDGISRVVAHYTFTQSMTFTLEAASLWSDTKDHPWSGPYSLTVTLSGGSTGGGGQTGGIESIVPVVGHLAGANGSVFRSDLKLFNPSVFNTATGRLQFTPLGQSASSTDAFINFTVAPNKVLFYSDVYAMAFPGGSGAARVAVIRTDTNTSDKLLVDTSTYTLLSNGGELGQNPTVFTPADFNAPFTQHITGILGKETERTNLFVMTSTDPVTVTWSVWSADGNLINTVSRSYPAQATIQVPLADIIGGAKGNTANAQIYANLGSGAARFAMTPVNNISNQGRWIDLKPVK